MRTSVGIGFTVVAMAMAALTGCNGTGKDSPAKSDGGLADARNPAAVHCEKNGGQSVIKKDKQGAEAGFCVFPDGREVDEWVYFRGETDSGARTGVGNSTGVGNPASQYCEKSGGKVEVETSEGGEGGVCVLPDGRRVDEWELYRTASSHAGSEGVQIGASNPASVHCEEVGGKSVNVTEADGSQRGVCEFPNGEKIDEWDLFREAVGAEKKGR